MNQFREIIHLGRTSLSNRNSLPGKDGGVGPGRTDAGAAPYPAVRQRAGAGAGAGRDESARADESGVPDFNSRGAARHLCVTLESLREEKESGPVLLSLSGPEVGKITGVVAINSTLRQALRDTSVVLRVHTRQHPEGLAQRLGQ